MPTNITPPIRTPLLTQNGAPLSIGNADVQTTRDWWMYWNQLGDQANANSQLSGEGAHANRPVTDNMPDGAIYVESDRSVIYQNQGGEWHYVAGTMWGTLSPDQRPTDLGVNDAGFEFRTDDLNPAYAPRQFLWSGSQWVETTMVLYGAHSARPPADSATPPRTIYVENDRGGVIYQQQANAWHFLAGTMWGTISPDQRPTDLGVNDAGFHFRTTSAPAREFIWSGSAWVEITQSPGNTAYLARATADIAMTTSGATVPGAQITVSQAGTYLIHADFYMGQAGADGGNFLVGNLLVNGATQAASADCSIPPGYFVMNTQQWLLSLSAGTVLSLFVHKTGGTGTSTAYASNTSISAVWISP